ncbi:MAG TPA: hypothetical protein EYG68_12880 [Leucothrix mucor]|nr:hypothetical protein [Leucothrix mucor]
MTPQNYPNWTRWLAQDADGTWWAYEHEPNEYHAGWYENEVGRYQKLMLTEKPEDCRKMLIKA